jgi:hypothetical protein
VATAESPAWLADRLTLLFSVFHARGQDEQTVDAVAAAIDAQSGTGLITAAELEAARAGAHTELTTAAAAAIAAHFGVPAAYLTDAAGADTVTQELQMLQAARDAGVNSVKLRQLSSTSATRSMLIDILGQIDVLAPRPTN